MVVKTHGQISCFRLQGATYAVDIAIRFLKDLDPCHASHDGHHLRSKRIRVRCVDRI